MQLDINNIQFGPAVTIDDFMRVQQEYSQAEGIRCSLLKQVLKNEDISKPVYAPVFSKGNAFELLLSYEIDEVAAFYEDKGLLFNKDEFPAGQYKLAIHLSETKEVSDIIERFREISNSRITDDKLEENILKYEKYINAVKSGYTSYCIERKEFNELAAIVDSQKSTEVYKRYIEDAEYQVGYTSLHATNDGDIVTLKCLADAVKENILVDYKYTEVNSIAELKNNIRRFRYDMQMAYYQSIFEQNERPVKPVLVFLFKNRLVAIELTDFDLEVGKYGVDINSEALSYNDYIVRTNIFGFKDAINIYLQMKRKGVNCMDDLFLEVKNGIFQSNIYGKNY